MNAQRLMDTHVQFGEDHWLSSNQPDQIEGTEGWAHSYDLDALTVDRDSLHGAGFRLETVIGLPFPSAPPDGYRAANEALIAAAEAAPLRVVPFVAVNPFDEGERHWLADVLDQGRPCGGIKLNPFLGRRGGYALTELADDDELVSLIDRHGLRVAMHVGTGREHLTRPAFPDVPAGPATAIELARRLPQVPMLMLHLLRLSPTALAAARELDNVFVDTSGLTSIGRISEGGEAVVFAEEAPPSITDAPSALRWLLEDLQLGHRLVFGSATPWATWWGSSLTNDAVTIVDAVPDAADLDAILFGNAQRLLARRGGS